MNNHRRSIPKGQRERAFAATAGACFYCGYAAECLDHILPYSYVAKNTDSNLAPACNICNSIASNKHFDNLQAKKEYILAQRATPHWKRKISRMVVTVVQPGYTGMPPAVQEPRLKPHSPPAEREPKRPRAKPRSWRAVRKPKWLEPEPLPQLAAALNVGAFIPSQLTNLSGPMAVRKLLGLTAAQMGSLLGGYKRQTIYTWERPERGERLPARYAMTSKARERYRALLTELVTLASGGRLQLYAILGPRRWGFALRGKCRECGRPFVVRRRGAVRCKRCIRKAKR